MSDGTQSGTPDATETQAAGATQAAKTPTQLPDDVKALHAKIGDLTDKLRKYEAAERAREEKEKLARGEFESVIAQLKAQNDQYARDAQELHAELSGQWEELAGTLPKDDKRFDGIFRAAAAGQALSIADLRYNLAEYRKLKRLGVLDAPQQRETKHAPAAKPAPSVTAQARALPKGNALHW